MELDEMTRALIGFAAMAVGGASTGSIYQQAVAQPVPGHEAIALPLPARAVTGCRVYRVAYL